MRGSVVIATVRPRALAQVLGALRQQTHTDFEVIVVEGPSVEAGRWERDHYPDVRVERCDEPNVSRARNVGLRAAGGELIAFLDDDATPAPTWLAELFAPYDDERVAGTGGIVLDDDGLWPWWGYAICDRLGHVSFSGLAPTTEQLTPGADPFAYFAGGNMSFRRERLEAVGGFDEEFTYLYDDADVCLRLIDHGAVLRPMASAPVHHHRMLGVVRSARGVPSDPYIPIKSAAYFAARHGSGGYSHAEVSNAIEGHARQLRSAAASAHRSGELTRAGHERFLERLSDGLIAGRERARRKGPRPGRPPKADTSSFAKFRVAGAEQGRLRICILAPESADGGGGGVGRVADETSRALAAVGHEVHVISLCTHGSGVALLDGVWRHRVAEIHRRLPSLRESPLELELYGAAAKYHEVRRVHNRAAVDLVVSTTWRGEGLLCVLDPELRTATRLVTPIGKVVELPQSDPAHERVVGLARLERTVLERSHNVQAASHAICHDMEATLGVTLPNARITPAGTADRAGARAERHARASEVEVLFVGRLEPRKGVDVLLDAAQQLVRECARAVFVIVGADNPDAGDYGEKLRARAAADPFMRERVRFLGRVEDARLWRLYAGADVVCAPSRYESYGNVLVEALMFSKPVVACRAGGMPEVIEDGANGLLARPGDSGSLRACLERLIDDRDLRMRYGARSRELYELRHTPARVAERTGRTYLEMTATAVAAPPSASPSSAPGAMTTPVAHAIAQLTALEPRAAEEVARALLDEHAQRIDYLSEALADWRYDDREFLTAIYRAILSREPDADGFARWAAHLCAGGSRFEAIAELASSAEAQARKVPSELPKDVLASHRRAIYKRSMEAFTLPDDAFLRSLHLAVLGRAPGAAWMDENRAVLAEGTSRESLAKALAESDEARSYEMPTDWLGG